MTNSIKELLYTKKHDEEMFVKDILSNGCKPVVYEFHNGDYNEYRRLCLKYKNFVPNYRTLITGFEYGRFDDYTIHLLSKYGAKHVRLSFYKNLYNFVTRDYGINDIIKIANSKDLLRDSLINQLLSDKQITLETVIDDIVIDVDRYFLLIQILRYKTPSESLLYYLKYYEKFGFRGVEYLRYITNEDDNKTHCTNNNYVRYLVAGMIYIHINHNTDLVYFLLESTIGILKENCDDNMYYEDLKNIFYESIYSYLELHSAKEIITKEQLVEIDNTLVKAVKKLKIKGIL